jgi:hypothetical protein
MRKAIRLLAAFFLVVAVGVGLRSERDATAMGAAVTADIDESALALNDMAKVEDVKTSEQQKQAKSSDDVVRDLIDAYMAKNNIQPGYNADKDKSFAMGIRAVGASTASPDFGKFRATAFDQAYGEALKGFVKAQAVQTSSQTVSSFFQDASTKAAEFTEDLSSGTSTFGALVDKIVALGDAVTSAKLEEYGIDPNQYNAASPDRKKVLLSESFRKVTTERAAMSLGGVVPIQTFIGQDGNGNESVGVLIMYSPKLQEIAKALRLGQKPALIKQGPPLRQVLPLEDPAKLYDLLGVRVLFDENGVVVVSYGQWASSYSGSDARLRSRYANTAFAQAETQANVQISEFLNTNFSSEDYSETGEAMERALIKEGRSGQIVEPDATSGIVDIRREIARRKSSAQLKGASALKRWTYTTPDGHEIVGVVKTYSFANMEAVDRQRGSGTGKSAPAGSGTPSGRSSEEQMDINTF